MKQIIGKIPIEIHQTDDLLHMKFSDGSEAQWFHDQGCCECVEIEEVIGDWDDLIGNPLLIADEREGDLPAHSEYAESYTWTFYTFRGIKGSVDVRWYGTSNGYYSESVTFQFKKANDTKWERYYNYI